MDRFLGSVTTRIGLDTSPSIKIRSPPGPINSTSLLVPTLTHTSHTGASPYTTSSSSPCTVESANNIGNNGNEYAPSISPTSRFTSRCSILTIVLACTSAPVQNPNATSTPASGTTHTPE